MNKLSSYIIAIFSGLLLGLSLGGTIGPIWGVVGAIGLVAAQVDNRLAGIENEVRSQNGKKPKWF